MSAKRIALTGAGFGLLVALGAGLGSLAATAGAMPGEGAMNAMSDDMAVGEMSAMTADATAPDGMEDATDGDGTGGMAAAGPRGMALGTATPPSSGLDDLTDGEIAMVAVTAGNVDIRYAHLALALSSDPDVRRFARTMIRDHAAVNEQAGAVVSQAGVEPVASDLSRNLEAQAQSVVDELARLRGAAFDRRYAENELSYHEFVNTTLRDRFIPSVESDAFRRALEGALDLFEGHEKLAGDLVEDVGT